MAYHARVYPHNDLLNLAHYHREIINDKVATENAEGIALDCMSCLIAMAFSVEALINFVGFKRIDGWEELQPYKTKIDTLVQTIGLEYDQDQEPFSTLNHLKTLRDQIAHGKPSERTVTVEGYEGIGDALETSWDAFLTPGFINHAFEQVDWFETHLYETANIETAETLTSGVGSIKNV